MVRKDNVTLAFLSALGNTEDNYFCNQPRVLKVLRQEGPGGFWVLTSHWLPHSRRPDLEPEAKELNL